MFGQTLLEREIEIGVNTYEYGVVELLALPMLAECGGWNVWVELGPGVPIEINAL